MESSRVKSEILILKIYQTFYISLLILIVFCHYLSMSKYKFIIKSIIKIFYCCIIIYCINFVFLLISDIYLFKKRKTPTIFNLFYKIMKIILFFALFKGVTLTIIYWINYKYYPKFIKYCPFNFSEKDVVKLIKTNNLEDNSKVCSIRRCVFQNMTNSGEYNYICNYNPNIGDYNSSIPDLKCQYVDMDNFKNKELYYYLEQCYRYRYYYECINVHKLHGKFETKYNQKCPSKFNKTRYIILGVLFPFIDIIADMVLLFFIYVQYKCIIYAINYSIFNSTRRFSPSSLNSTKENSIICNNVQTNTFNQLNNKTELIIYPPDIKFITKDKSVNIMLNDSEFFSQSKEDFIKENNSKIFP